MDMGTGPGQVISAVLESPNANDIPASARIVAADVSQQFVTMVSSHQQKKIEADNSLWSRVEPKLWDARDLNDVADGTISHLLSSFVYFALNGETEGLTEAFRVLRAKEAGAGIFVTTSMGYTEWGRLPLFIKEVQPKKTVPEPGIEWGSTDGVLRILKKAGFAT